MDGSIYVHEQNHRFTVYLTNSKILQSIDESIHVSSNAKVRVACSFPLSGQFPVRLNLNEHGVPFPIKDITCHRVAACGAEKTMHVERHEAALLPVCAEILPGGARQPDEHILQLHNHMSASGRYVFSPGAIVLDGVHGLVGAEKVRRRE
jgi:hypothetical protein